jgi:glycerophosphoryl diester phosphodiesterase
LTLVVAHRGAAQQAPQNSVKAFLDAQRQGADGVELDVRRSRDGALVVNHDPEIPGKGPICDLDVADLPDHVALLSEVMVACGDLLVNVEIKNSPDEPGYDPSGALVAQVLAELAEIDPRGEVIISSFDLATVSAVRQQDPAMATGLLLEPRANLDAAIDVATGRGFTAIHPFVIGCTPSAVARAHGAGIAVNVWTVNGAEDARDLVAMGADAIITDDVEMVRGVVEAVG